MYLPSEWHKQEFVQLTWPHRATDWAPVYDQAIDCYCTMAREIAARQPLLIVTQSAEKTRSELAQHDVPVTNMTFAECPTNDTWARDHAFISCIEGSQRMLLDFQFNGWGMKFAANHDNQINQQMHRQGVIDGTYVKCLDFVLEGGSIESDGEGTILTTASCLLAPNRNDLMDRSQIDNKLRALFNAKRILWLNHSWLAGDDTDGHVDTVARLCSANTIAYVQCLDQNDEHYTELSQMESELQQFRTAEGDPYRLIPLPMPNACYDDEGNRLPATYANFLIMNDAVLYPTYSQPEKDHLAAEQLQKAFPDKEIVGIDCRVLIIQHGSLHCCTMQYPVV